MLDLAVRDIHDYCINHSTRLNPRKCKEMVVNFMKSPNTLMRPLRVGNQGVGRVSSYKLLGVIISDDLKWNCHVNYIISKAVKRLYARRLLKRAGVQAQDILRVYRSNVRPILEYALQVWQNIPDYLLEKTESVQKRAFRII